jgi:2-hydroxychromene-2-carboxylate isomerase
VDARCGAPCAELAAEIAARKWATLGELIGEALVAGRPAPAIPPVAEADVDAHLAAHAADFSGPPERDRAAVRFALARDRRRAAEAERVAAERVRRPPELRVDAGSPALVDAADRVLAEAGGRTIRNRDVEKRLALVLYRLRGALARERRRQLDALVAERLWAAEAAARGLPVDDLRREVRAHVAPVGDADVDRYFETEVRARDPHAEKRPARIRPYLEFLAGQAAEDAFLADLRRRAGVRVALAEPVAPRLALGPGANGWRGPARPGGRVVFLTSYRGTTSRAMWPVVRALAATPGTALAVRPLLPQWDPEATAVAAAVRCAGRAGKQWVFHDAVAGAEPLPDRAGLERTAATLGLDAHAFAACLDDPATAAAVAAESAEAERLGLDEPPAVLVDGTAFGGMQDVEALRAAFSSRRAGGAARSASPSPGRPRS